MLEKLKLRNIVSNFVYIKARKMKLKNKVTILNLNMILNDI